MSRRVYAISIYSFPTPRDEAEAQLEELIHLVTSAGFVLVGSEIYQLRQAHAHSYLGPGKLQNLLALMKSLKVDLIVLDGEAKGYQIKNVEDACNIEVADRTRIILEIFKKRAQSKEGKLQVQLSEAEYETGRLIGGRGIELSGLGRGVRGPGEHIAQKQRRAYMRKIVTLRQKLDEVKKTRRAHVSHRREQERPLISLVGYTNAGKSTLMNVFAKSVEVKSKDQLFTTVDPTTRRVYMGSDVDGKPRFVFLTDTVGFIRRLPHQLVDGFESTLEMVASSELVLVVVDVSKPDFVQDEQIVLDTLDKIGSKAPILRVYNKIDRLAAYTFPVPQDTILVSATTGKGMELLKKEILKRVGYDQAIDGVVE